MSGVYLTVWTDDARRAQVLRTTKGGYPHITLGYSGDKLCRAELLTEAVVALRDSLLAGVTVTHAKINSFDLNRGKGEPRMRHDVLMMLDRDTGALVDKMRENMGRDYPEGTFSTGEPHITHAIFDSADEAAARVLKLQDLLPMDVRITGVTVD